jgi:uncharacterized metal-binding protein
VTSAPSDRANMSEPSHLKCALCGVSACEDEPDVRQSPPFCPSLLEPELLAEVDKVYQESESIRTLAQAAARTEASGYMRRTRIEDTMDFARRLGAERLGIAHCVGFMQEARLACKIFEANGFEVYSICCKVGSVEKETLGLADADKIVPGTFEPICNPVAQAALLAQAGTQLNVVMGLCVGHDTLFMMHSQAPYTVLAVKDRVLGHNPVAALYLSKSYYNRLLKVETADDYLRRLMP